MVSSKKKTGAFTVDLERPVQLYDLIEKLLDGGTGLSTTLVNTEKGPFLVYRFHERTFIGMHELLEHLKSIGILNGGALEAT